MVGAFVLMHNHHFFFSRFQCQELFICFATVSMEMCYHKVSMMLLRHLSFFFFLFGAHHMTLDLLVAVIAIR